MRSASRAGFTVVLCAASACGAGDEGTVAGNLIDALRGVVRASRYGVLVSAGCLFGAAACGARAGAPVVLVQACDPGRRPTGLAVRIGPLRTGADVDALVSWLRTRPPGSGGAPGPAARPAPASGRRATQLRTSTLASVRTLWGTAVPPACRRDAADPFVGDNGHDGAVRTTVLAPRLTVPVQWLGCMRVVPSRERDSPAVLNRALDLGVTFLDTADLYSDGRNEELIGRVVRQVGAGRPEHQVRRPPPPPGGEMCLRGDPAYVRGTCEASLRRLGIDVT